MQCVLFGTLRAYYSTRCGLCQANFKKIVDNAYQVCYYIGQGGKIMENNAVGKRILQIREEAGLKQEEFAESLGLTKSAISGYETGRRVPSNAILKSIAQTFSYNENWLLYGNGNPKTFEIYEGLHAVFTHFKCSDYERAFLGKYFGMGEKDRHLFCHYMNYLFRDIPHEFDPEQDLIQDALLELQNESTSETPTTSDDVEALAQMAAELTREQAVIEKKPDVSASSAKESDVG